MTAEQSANDLAKQHLLLVDDDPLILNVMEKMLANLGFENVSRSGGGEEALEILKQGGIDLLLTDIEMPEFNGLELIRQLRGGLTYCSRDTPAIIFSAVSSDETLCAALALDVNGFVPKPVKPLALVDKLLAALSEREYTYRPADDYLDVETDIDTLLKGFSTAQGDESSAPPEKETQVSIFALQPDMTLSREVRHKNGSLLMSAGFVLRQNTINRLMEIHDDIADEQFYVEPMAVDFQI